jgi:uncharacterized protein with GYD domain
MPRFASTIRFTQQGLQGIAETTRRAASFRASAKKLGVKVVDLYWSLGPFDGLLIFDAPDSQVATAAMLQLASLGNVHTQTAEVFAAAEMDSILQKMK